VTRYLAAAVKISEHWRAHLPEGTSDIIDEPGDDELAAIIEEIFRPVAAEVAAEINATWRTRIIRSLPFGVVDCIIDQPTNIEVAAMVCATMAQE
jgi:hypothetical protein